MHHMPEVQVAAELEIRNLQARLAHLADFEEGLEEYITLFSEDARWSLLARPNSGDAALEHVGRKDILEGALARRSSGTQGPGSGVMHDLTTVEVSLASDAMRATSVAYFKFFGDTGGEPKILMMGRYLDEFVVESGQWRLASRVIVPA